jgi:hypothetical protein
MQCILEEGGREGGREGGIGNEKFGATTYLTFLIKY